MLLAGRASPLRSHAPRLLTTCRRCCWCLQEEDVMRLEEQARKDAEKRAAAERKARERRNKARATTG